MVLLSWECAYLVRTTGRYENSLASPLVDAVAVDALRSKQAPNILIEVVLLRMNWVAIRRVVKVLAHQIAQLVRVFSAEDVPCGARRLGRLVLGWALGPGHDVDGVSNVHMKTRGAFRASRLERGKRVVHLGPCFAYA